MMRLLDRTKPIHTPSRSKAAKTSEDPPLFSHGDLQQRPSLQIEQLDAALRRRDVKTLRPQTADDGNRYAKMARMSFFEAFAIDAGNDTFAFPKPSSAKTTKEVETPASFAPSREASPMIGIAFGSPSHPPQYWNRYPSFSPSSSNATPRTPRFTEFFDVHSSRADVTVSSSPLTRSTSTWKKVGSLFRRATRATKIESKSIATPRLGSKANVPAQRPTTSQQSPQLATSHRQPRLTRSQTSPRLTSSQRSPRPKSRSRTMFPRAKSMKEVYSESPPVDSKVDLESSPVMRAPEVRVSSETRSDSVQQHDERPHRPPKISTELETDDAVMRVNVPALSPESIITQIVAIPIPRLELQLPSYQLERYSVMFEKVLDPKPSLLERRKSRLRMMETNVEERDIAHNPSPLGMLAGMNTSAGERRPLSRSVTSPSVAARKLSHVTAIQKPLPPIQRSNTIPLLRISPLQTGFGTGTTMQSTILDSPVSANDNEYTLPHTHSVDSVRMFTNVPTNLDMLAPKETTKVWQSILPAPPGSSTSSRFSIDVHAALDSPRLLNRSRSYNGRENASHPIVRQVQVAVARKVSVSLALNSAHFGDPTHTLLKPRMIHVGAQAHSRKTSVLDTDTDILGVQSSC